MHKDLIERNCLNMEYSLLHGLYFTGKKEEEDYIFCYSNIIDDEFWNIAYVKNKLNKEKLSKIEKDFSYKNRTPSLYIGRNDTYYDENKKLILENNYKLNDTDVYMVLDQPKEIDINLDIKVVENQEEYKDFMRVISSAYNDSVENPDENVYADCITECYYHAIKNTINSEKNLHIIAYDNKVPVSVATLSYADGIGGINNVGTAQSHWNKGYGKQVIMYVIKKFQELGGGTLTLSTEYQSKNQKFYEKLGFKEIYVMEQYIK